MSATFVLTFRYHSGSHRQSGGEVPNTMWSRMLPLCFAASSGMLGTQSVVFAKSLSVLLRGSWHSPRQLLSSFFLANLVGFGVTAAFWVQRLNKVNATLHFPLRCRVQSAAVCQFSVERRDCGKVLLSGKHESRAGEVVEGL